MLMFSLLVLISVLFVFFLFLPHTHTVPPPTSYPSQVDTFVADALSDEKFDDDNAETAGDGKIISPRSETAKVLKDQHIEVEDLRGMEARELTNMGLTLGLSKTLLLAAQAKPKSFHGKPYLKIPIRHMFMLKKLIEDENSKLWLTGTIVQYQFGCDKGFEIRVNDAAATDGMLIEGRSTYYRNLGRRRTYNVRLPLEKEMQYVIQSFLTHSTIRLVICCRPFIF